MAAISFNAVDHQAVVNLPLWERWKRGLKALLIVARDPDRTDKVLEAYEHLNAGTEARRADAFYASSGGEQLFLEDRTLDATTVDFDALARLPEGTLGNSYARFMRERNLTPDIFAARGALSRSTYVIKRLRQAILSAEDADFFGNVQR